MLSRKWGHSLDTDARLFFALGNALLDAGIAAWAAKYRWDFVRPVTAIRHRYKGKPVTSWLGPYQSYGTVPGERWIPYQAPNVVTPPFPEYVSGHSTFSSAAAAILARFTGSDAFGAGVTIEVGTSLFEPRTATQVGTPATDITLSWPTATWPDGKVTTNAPWAIPVADCDAPSSPPTTVVETPPSTTIDDGGGGNGHGRGNGRGNRSATTTIELG